MNWIFRTAKTHFTDFAQTWDLQNQRLYQNHPLFDSAFVAPLVQYFASDDDLIAVAEQANKRSSLLLLTRKRGGWETFLPSQTQLAPVLIDQDADLPGLLRALPGYSMVLDFLCQDPDYSPWSQLTSLKPQNLRIVPHAVTMNIDLSTDSFETYWQQRSKNLRNNMKSRFKRVKKDDYEVNLNVVTGPDAVEQAVIRYGEMESRSWKAKIGTAIHQGNIQGQFYRDVLVNFASKNQAMVYELTFNDQPVASKLALHNDFMLINLKKTFDEQWSKYSPGRLLDYLQIEHEFTEQRYKTMEFYTNASADQLSLSTGQRTISHHTLYRTSLLKQLYSGVQNVKNRLKRPSDEAEAVESGQTDDAKDSSQMVSVKS